MPKPSEIKDPKGSSQAALMVQGTTSDAGKSILVAGLCRVFQRRGLSVAPFKPQNMALNSAVTPDGGEIGRAQALQAQAAKVPLSVHMNPILLKPNTDTGAQVIIQGHSIGNIQALDYHEYKPKAAKSVFDSFKKLGEQYETIIIEGAGSPAEINLRKGDIANMGFALPTKTPVIIIADIDKGGVFAHLVGTLNLLAQDEQDLVKGFVINRFRGDIALLQDGLDWLEEHTGKPVLGVLPYLHGLHLDAEDAVPDKLANDAKNRFKIIIPLLPHISNHTDFEPLRLHPELDVEYIKHLEAIPPADLIILPGSKNVGFDLDWLKSQGWEEAINKHLRYGGKVIGICGGLQMLGNTIDDPLGIEGEAGNSHQGLGLMDYQTDLQAEKQLTNVTGSLALGNNSSDKNAEVKGYEIHAGITQGKALENPVLMLDGKNDGAISTDNQILVTYLHGLFDSTDALNQILAWAGTKMTQTFNIDEQREQQLNRLADAIEESMDIEQLLEISQLS